MNRTESQQNLLAALALAQAELKNPHFDSTNPHFKSKFASLAAVRAAVIPVFSKHGLSVMQFPVADGHSAGCLTIVGHKSGEYVEEPFMFPVDRPNAHGYASVVTYAKRIAMQSVAGVVGDEDDDANAGTDTKPQQTESGASGAAACKDEYQALSTDAQAEIEDLAFRIRTLLKKKDIRGAYDEIEANGMMRHDDGSMHQENRMALSSRLQSDERAALKKEGERRRTYIDEKAAA